MSTTVTMSEMDVMKRLDERSFAFYTAEMARTQKSTGLTYVLWFFFGWLGIHKFYLARKLGYAYLGSAGLALVALIRMTTAVFAGGTASGLDGLLMLLGAGSILFLVVALMIDLFTIPGQVEQANSELRLALLRRLEYLTTPADEDSQA